MRLVMQNIAGFPTRAARLVRTHGLPLVGKELIEQAARPRTYVIRVVYAVLLSLIASLIFFAKLEAFATSPLAALGSGRDLFIYLVCLQFAGVYLFMPAMTCGVITSEKERNSLQLLILTRLGTWTILFEKLLGRLIPMLGFLLLSLPLLAYCYSLGGLSPRILWTGAWLLLLGVFQMGTLALACSAYFRTTVGAFVASYILAFGMFFGPFFCWMLVYLVTVLVGLDIDDLFRFFGANTNPGLMFVGMFPFFGPPIAMANGSAIMPGGIGFWPLMGHSTLILGVSAFWLVLARRWFFQRAFLPPKNYLREMFKKIDRGISRSENGDEIAVASGVPHTRTARDLELLPADDPVAWREVRLHSLGRRHRLLHPLLLIEVPLILFCAFLALVDSYGVRVVVGLMHFVLWMLAVLIVSVRSASLISGERSRQTLDVLCTTPLAGREIVLQKFRGVQQLILALAVPLCTLALFNAWWTADSPFANRMRQMAGQNIPTFHAWRYIVCAALAAVVYLPMIGWLSLGLGLKIRSHARALIASMAAIVTWCVAPLIFIVVPLSILLGALGPSFRASGARGAWSYLAEAVLDSLATYSGLLSPATLVFLNEDVPDWLDDHGGWVTIAANFVSYGIATLWFRTLCLRHADRLLGRTEPMAAPPSSNGAAPGLSAAPLAPAAPPTEPMARPQESSEVAS